MALHHAHNHEYAPANYNQAFGIGVALNLAYIVLEAMAGLMINSLALLADAGHNLSDVLSLLLAWGAAHVTGRPPTERRTYGMRRASILAALANAVILLIAIGAIAWAAVLRIRNEEPVAGGTIMWVAGAGVVVNGITALLFMKGRHRDLNIKGAFMHMALDAAISLGVVAAGLAIRLTGYLWLDPAVSLAIVFAIAIGTWGLLRESLNLALDAVPSGIDLPAVRSYLENLPSVSAVHDLHIWGMSTTETALTAHLIRKEPRTDDALLAKAARELNEKFQIVHVTLQFETGDECNPCQQAGRGF
ncbi:MAG: cation diffusion facilitator family transporter [Candidatus Omnitrophica bacterium]|nr:cation diffusion facilitator family transporter [Candidatus Omnitrophota bacterium]